MPKITFIALLTLSISVSAQVTLTTEEREVIDSLVATYSAMVPMALLPADWPPDVDKVLREGYLKTKDMCGVALNIASRIDALALFRPTFHQGVPEDYLPIQPTRHDDSTEVAYTNLDSGFAYIRWQQNRRDPLAMDKIHRALDLVKGDRCIILDLRKFDTGSIDSVLKALTCFTTDDKVGIRLAKRENGEDRDTIITFSYDAETNPWNGPLLIVTFMNGWPSSIMGELFRGRPYVTNYSESNSGYFSGYEYANVNLPHGYQCHVPVSALLDVEGNAIKTFAGMPGCGTIDQRDKRDIYQRYQDLARNSLNRFLEENTSKLDEIAWQIEDFLDFHFADRTPSEQLVE